MRFEDPATVLVAEARALLGAAERREPVSVARARAFARACVEMTERGRAAMAVMDGGVFAGARLVELATAITHGDSSQLLTASALPSVVSKKAP